MQHQLNAQLQAERDVGQELQQALTVLQDELAAMRNTFAWRLAAPLRAAAGWFKPEHEQTKSAVNATKQPVAVIPPPIDSYQMTSDIQELTTNHSLSESTNMTSNHAAQVLQSAPSELSPQMKTLLQYQDRQFVEFAYMTLLKRPADPEGLNYYLGRLRAGVPKIQILGQIIDSHEARTRGIELPGLRSAVKLHKFSRIPLLRHFFKLQNKYLSSMFSGTTLEYAKIQRQLDLIQGAIITDLPRSDQLLTTQNCEMMIDKISQESVESRIRANAEMEVKLNLLADRSIDEPTWLRYLGRVINLKLIAPLCIAGTRPPAANLIVIIDSSKNIGTVEERIRTRNCLSALLDASEYPVKPFWYVHSNEFSRSAEMGNSLATIFQVVNNRDIKKHICDEDLVLVLRPGDEIRPEIHMALKYFGSFDATFTLIDMYFRDNNRIFPVLLHAVDPIHASYCDYFFGRYAANGKHFKQHLNHTSNATPSEIGVEICSQLKVEDNHSHRHIAIPLLCLQTSNTELSTLRENIILERASSTCKLPSLGSLQGIEALEKLPAVIQQTKTVSAIICTKDCGLLLRQLLHRLERETLIQDIIIISNNTTNVHAIKTLIAASKLEQVTVLDYNGPFNFSRQCNLGAKYAKGDVFLFLNDDMAPVSDDWLQCLLNWMDSPRIVGPLLIYPNETVQHAGMHLGFNGVAGHVMRHSRLPSGDYGFFLTSPRRVSCLTGAALMMPKSLFKSLNGFDPMLATYLQDVDISLRALHSGCELVFDPRSILMHMESVSVIPTLNDTKIKRTRELEYAYFNNRWGNALESDKWMNSLFDPMDESLTVLRI